MKNLILFFLISISTITYANDIDYLSGDKKTACEVVLCLSSSTRPSECHPPIAKYFAIKVYHHGSYSPSKTMNARKDFLKLCPASSESNEMEVLVDAMSKQEISCTPDELNKQTEKQKKWSDAIRYLATLPSYCAVLFDHQYTDYIKKPVYTCQGQWYTEKEWKQGYRKKQISFKKYRELASKGEKVIRESGGRDSPTTYYQIIPVEKNCWQWSN